MNWMCPIDGESEVWPTPVAALSHIYNVSGGGHGESSSIQRHDGEVLFPEPTNANVTMATVEDKVGSTVDNLPKDIQSFIGELEEDGYELPPVLDEHDLHTFEMVQVSQSVTHDIEYLENRISYFNEIFSKILSNWDNLTESTEQVEIEPDDDDDDDDDNTNPAHGKYTTEDVLEREETEVMRILEESTFLDNHGSDLIECFKFVYEKRAADDNQVYIDQVQQSTGMPPGLVEDNLDQLVDFNLIRHDQSDDSYFVPY